MPLYFAYGSNMATRQTADRCSSMRFASVAELSNYALGFTRWSAKRGCGVADVVAAHGCAVWGAVFEVSDADFDRLDRYEGATLTPPAYRRISVTTRAQDGTMLSALTYGVAVKSIDNFKPSREYMGLILQGAEHWRLPSDYIEELKQIEVQ